MRKYVTFVLVFCVLFLRCLPISANADDPKIDAHELAETLLSTIHEKTHPYILYESSDIATLRDKVKQKYSKEAYTYVKKTADRYLNYTITVSKSSKGIIGRQLQSYISYLATAGVIEDDGQKYYDKAVDLVISAAEQGSVDVYHTVNDALCVADFGYAYALAYDWLYHSMTDEQRAILKTELYEIGEYLYTNSSALNTWGSSEERRQAWNWNAVTHGCLGMISLALGERNDWLALSIDRTIGYYRYAVDQDGAAMEGLHYIGYALNTLAPFDYTVRMHASVGLMDGFPAMQKIPEWSMNMTAPYGKEQAMVGQGDNLGNYAASFYIIHQYGLEEELWGWEQTYGTKIESDYAGNGWNAPAMIFYEDQALEARKPEGANGLQVNSYEKGLVIARDGWTSDSSMITFTCGYGYQGCWNHPDDNSFTFFANGESFVIDLGANHLKSSDHNVCAVDGVGMDYTGGPTMIKGTLEENKILPTGALYLRGNNTASYANKAGLVSSERQLIYHGGNTPFVLIYDYAQKDGAEHTFTTNFYTDKDARITVDGSNAVIRGGNKRAKCYVFTYSDSGVSLSKTQTDKTLALTTSNTASTHAQATIFITPNEDGSMPQVEWLRGEDRTLTVTITKKSDSNAVTESYIFSDSGLENVKMSVNPIPDETERVTDEKQETTQTTEQIQDTAEYTDKKSNGCSSIVHTAELFFIVIIALLTFL